MNLENKKVLINIIGAVETGGQIYGRRRYSDYTPPYKNSPKEYTITLGWAAFYGGEARQLIQLIFDTDKELFRSLDTAGIEGMLSKDWVDIKWNPTSAQKEVLISLIDSEVGHECQDNLFMKRLDMMIEECSNDYTTDIPAQMMYCEIRHLGGRGPVRRIFDRCNGNYSLDNIMASLKKDQEDTSSSNQVGDKIYWSRHEKCYEFIKKYSLEEKEEKIVAVRVGSARIDERGDAEGGKPGDQLQKNIPDWSGEVAIENWYLHKKGWYVIRANSATVRKKIAYAMEAACNNKHIGYAQDTRYKAQDWCKYKNGGNYDPATITEDVNVDCSALVRLCVTYAGVTVGDMYTGSMPRILKETGQFTVISDTKITNSSDYQMLGDILVTRSTGHTVVVLDDGAKIGEEDHTKEEWKATGTATCTEDGVNVRKTPGGTVIMQAGKGNRFEVDGQISGDWVHIRIATIIGWMHKDYVKYDTPVKPDPAPAPTGEVIGTGVALENMKIRKGPGTEYSVIGYLDRGTEVEILEQLNSGWLKIVWTKAENGYAYVSNRNSAYFKCKFKEEELLYKVLTSLYIRKGPGTSYAVSGLLQAGETIKISEITNGWGKLEDGRGYSSIKYLKQI